MFYNDKGYTHNFSSPRSFQQNGLVKQKNRKLQYMARTLIVEHFLSQKFWAEAVSTDSHVLNRTLIRHILKRTPYEFWNGK